MLLPNKDKGKEFIKTSNLKNRRREVQIKFSGSV